jgi:hypothetical protein
MVVATSSPAILVRQEMYGGPVKVDTKVKLEDILG